MGIHRLLLFLRKLKSVCGPARLLLFLRDKFVVRRQLKTFRKNQNCTLRPNSSRSTFNKKRSEFQICLKNREYLEYGFEKRISGVIFCRKDNILESERKLARTPENITFCNTIPSGFGKPREHTDGEMTPFNTLQTKVVK